MKYFDRYGRYNFIDENNVFVGFDSDSQCCEIFGWFYSSALPVADATEGDIPEDANLDNFTFDINFIHEHRSSDVDDGAVSFRLINPMGEIAYLTLFNHQNGYYSHGFEFKIGDNVIKEGSL